MKLVEQVFPAGSTRHMPSLWVTTRIGSLHTTGSLLGGGEREAMKWREYNLSLLNTKKCEAF